MKKIFALLVACVAFSTASFAAETTTTNEIACSQSSAAEKVKGYINKLYQAAVNDNYETFERTLREMEAYLNNFSEAEQEKIFNSLNSWAETNGYKMIKISEYGEYAEDVREGRIQR